MQKKKPRGKPFSKGYVPWNKGTKGLSSGWERGKPRGVVTTGAFKKKHLLSKGNKNGNWKGNLVGYFALHTWIRKVFVKTGICSECGKSAKTDWANITGVYERARENWAEMCRSCHMKHDLKRQDLNEQQTV